MHTYLIAPRVPTLFPLTLVPFRLLLASQPTGKHPRMHQQPQIQRRGIVSKGRVIEYKGQVLSTRMVSRLPPKSASRSAALQLANWR